MKLLGIGLLALVALPLFSKAPTDKITLSREGRSVEITDVARLEQFRFGGGPGNCNPWQPGHSKTIAEGCSDPGAGWIADWISGSIPEPDRSLPRYEVTSHFGEGEKRQSVVYFVYSPITRKGYIYLPGPKEAHYWENVSLLGRGKQWEGHWFWATPEWTSAAQALIAHLR